MFITIANAANPTGQSNVLLPDFAGIQRFGAGCDCSFFLILRRPQFKLSGSECLAIIVKRDKA